jgi:hypothetical protein
MQGLFTQAFVNATWQEVLDFQQFSGGAKQVGLREGLAQGGGGCKKGGQNGGAGKEEGTAAKHTEVVAVSAGPSVGQGVAGPSVGHGPANVAGPSVGQGPANIAAVGPQVVLGEGQPARLLEAQEGGGALTNRFVIVSEWQKEESKWKGRGLFDRSRYYETKGRQKAHACVRVGNQEWISCSAFAKLAKVGNYSKWKAACFIDTDPADPFVEKPSQHADMVRFDLWRKSGSCVDPVNGV